MSGRIEVTRGGPYLVTGGLPLYRGPDEQVPTGEVYTLCRCGGYARKPFCDGTHRRTGVDDSRPGDAVAGDAVAGDAVAGDPPRGTGAEADRAAPGVHVVVGGPLLVTGDVPVHRPDGTVTVRSCAELCRCGRSGTKPFCDGSHAGATVDPG